LSEELPALLGPDAPALLKSVRLLWRHGPASRELGSQRVYFLSRRQRRDLVFVTAQLDGAGRDDQNHHRDTYDN
jgi:hypothetical protein